MSNAKVTITNINGPALRESIHDGERFAGGEIGQSYAIKVENLTHGRILAVITVDGRNVLDASPGDHAGSGYVIGSRQSYSCEGWRVSNESVASFVFTEGADSYAAKTLGDGSHVGIIGVAVFVEAPVYRMPAASPRLAMFDNGGDVMRGGQTRSAGTGFGESRASHVTSTTFRRHGSPEIHTIRYDTTAMLVEDGIMLWDKPKPVQPFPASAAAFCPLPASRG